ncbi:hypothetical protein [uncultured Actinomyces sp.]|uniref:hypothetical protein n=1 Tax=uncultured Actinomyces sp. TaxID=249061 RepID=UPI00345D1939
MLSVPLGPPPELPTAPGRLLGAVVRMSVRSVVATALATGLGYLCGALIPLALGHLLDAGLERGLGAHLAAPLAALVGLALLNTLAAAAVQTAEIASWGPGTWPRRARPRTGSASAGGPSPPRSRPGTWSLPSTTTPTTSAPWSTAWSPWPRRWAP